jgi:subtilisin
LDDTTRLSRRTVLRTTGGALAGTGLVATASATPDDNDRIRANVGYAAPGGRAAARDAASAVVWEFAFDALTVDIDEERTAALRDRSDIRYVERDVEMETLDQTLPWGIDRVDAEVAHDAGETGASADVAVIDTGIDSDHPDLVDNLGKGRAFLSGIESDNWEDDNGHGTHCAGIADAVGNDEGVVGVATEATLHAVKVMNAIGTGLTSDIAKGIEYTADQGWDVGSLSLGSSSYSETLENACAYAQGEGVFLSAAAGNDGECTDCVSYPAAYDECVAVSATTEDDDLASFSSQGPEVELAAPGEDIYSTYLAGYNTLSGTSMACPHVSGAAGQLMANGYTNEEARQRLKDTAEDIGLAENESGTGLLDVAAALGLDSSDDLS